MHECPYISSILDKPVQKTHHGEDGLEKCPYIAEHCTKYKSRPASREFLEHPDTQTKHAAAMCPHMQKALKNAGEAQAQKVKAEDAKEKKQVPKDHNEFGPGGQHGFEKCPFVIKSCPHFANKGIKV